MRVWTGSYLSLWSAFISSLNHQVVHFPALSIQRPDSQQRPIL